MERERFDVIKDKHGAYSSWAVWSPATHGPKSNIGDMTELDPNVTPAILRTVKPSVMMVGLNISRSFDESFRNFHDRRASAMDFKLRAAFTGTPYWGAYMTDVVKNVEMVKSKDLLKHLRRNPAVLDSQIRTLREEIRDLGCRRPIILAFGADAFRVLHRHLAPGEYRALVRLTHYSHYIGHDQCGSQVFGALARGGDAGALDEAH